jgi:hypothetical protein
MRGIVGEFTGQSEQSSAVAVVATVVVAGVDSKQCWLWYRHREHIVFAIENVFGCLADVVQLPIESSPSQYM